MDQFTPLEYIKIDVASNFGLDKEDWDVRLDWFDTHETEILQMLQDVRAGKHNAQIKILRDASEPALFFAGSKAYEQALRGEDISYPISLDATASGAQLLAILIGCEKSARLCNVIDTGHREDLYTNGYQGMLSRAQDSAKLTRPQVKDAIMTLTV